MYVIDDKRYTPVATSILKWRGKEYNIKDVYIIVDGIPHDITKLKRGLNQTIISFWNDEKKHGGWYFEEHDVIESIIEDVVPKSAYNSTETNFSTDNKLTYDHPNAMSLGSGIIWYILIMFGGLIFKDWLLIWIFATIIFVLWIIKKPKFKD